MRSLLAILAVFIFLLPACDGGQESKNKDSGSKLGGEDKVLAKVGGNPITAYDVDRYLVKAFGEYAGRADTPELRKKALESLVAAKAISKARVAEMSKAELKELDRQVAVEREQILIRQYVAKRAGETDITDDMIRAYYESHRDQFGAGVERSFELISCTDKMTKNQRDSMIELLRQASGNKDWQKWTEKMAGEGKPLTYITGQLGGSLLSVSLNTLGAKLKNGESSQITFENGKPCIIRVSGETSKPPKPLEAVRSEIRKTLGVIETKKILTEVMENMVKSSDVQYLEAP